MATNLEALGARNLSDRRSGPVGVRALAGADSPWMWTPGALKARARATHRAILDLNEGIAGQVKDGDLPEEDPELGAWRRFRDSFGVWFGGWSDEGPGGALGTGGWSATAATLEDYEGQIRQWRAWYVGKFGEEAPGRPPPKKPGGLFDGLEGAAKWLAIGAGAYAVATLARSFRLRRF